MFESMLPRLCHTTPDFGCFAAAVIYYFDIKMLLPQETTEMTAFDADMLPLRCCRCATFTSL